MYGVHRPGWSALGALVLLLACEASGPAAPASAKEMREVQEPSPGSDIEPDSTSASRVEVVGDEVEQRPLVLETDPELLIALEGAGLTAGPIAFGGGDGRIASFRERAGLMAIRRALERDAKAVAREDARAGVGMRHAHRLFDTTWLSNDVTRLELVGLANRLDRSPFAPEHCGETRLVYRLAYASEVDGEPVASRLPMTFNVVFWQDDPDEDGSCGEVARRWMAPVGLQGKALADWLRREEGPLAPTRLSRARLKSVEVDLQLVRWPAVVHPSLGGHAEYILRVFQPDGEGLTPAPLENTPDVDRLRRDDEARAELLAWLRDPAQRSGLEDGTALMPERFAASRVISVAPRGLGRLANRPWSQLFGADDLEGLGLEGGTHVRSPRGLLRRLDGLSCSGCHQTRSVAGFHLVGEARDPERILDVAFLPSSPHLDGDLERRASYVRAVASGQPGAAARPLSDHARHDGAYGSHCGRGDPGLAHWTCEDGLECRPLDDPDFGVCLPATAGAGDPCERGTLRTNRVGHKDRVRDLTLTSCGDAVCNTSDVGFPTGMCTADCEGLGEGEACGAIVNLASFNACLARKRPFTRCIEAAAFPAGMRSCDTEHRCREDYICARSPNEPDRGVCIPPYFLFQLRVDGHVM